MIGLHARSTRRMSRGTIVKRLRSDVRLRSSFRKAKKRIRKPNRTDCPHYGQERRFEIVEATHSSPPSPLSLARKQ